MACLFRLLGTFGTFFLGFDSINFHYILEWRHVLPVDDSPVTAALHGTDPFVIEKCPHVLIVGNQPRFESEMLVGTDNPHYIYNYLRSHFLS